MAIVTGNVPTSVSAVPGLSLVDLHVELRLQLWKHLLDLNETPLKYQYKTALGQAKPKTCPESPSLSSLERYCFQLMLLEHQSRRRFLLAKRESYGFFKRVRGDEIRKNRTFKCNDKWFQDEFRFGDILPVTPVSVTTTHSVILVSKQLGAEYRQVYYERTDFELILDSKNVLRAIPGLVEVNRPDDDPGCLFPTPNCWSASNDLFENVRRCAFFIQFTSIELVMYSDPSQQEDLIRDAYLDNSITKTIKSLIASMRQIRSIFIGCITHLDDRIPLTIAQNLNLPRRIGPPISSVDLAALRKISSEPWFVEHEKVVADYNWNLFVKSFALILMKKRSLRDLCITIGDMKMMEFKSQIDSKGKWSPSEDYLNTVRYYGED